MRSTTMRLRRIGGCAALFAVATIAGLTWATDEPAPSFDPQAFAAQAQPGPEHEVLDPLVGSWNYTCKMWMVPGQPAMESTGKIERKWILGDRFLEEKVTGTNFDGSPGFEGLG